MVLPAAHQAVAHRVVVRWAALRAKAVLPVAVSKAVLKVTAALAVQQAAVLARKVVVRAACQHPAVVCRVPECRVRVFQARAQAVHRAAAAIKVVAALRVAVRPALRAMKVFSAAPAVAAVRLVDPRVGPLVEPMALQAVRRMAAVPRAVVLKVAVPLVVHLVVEALPVAWDRRVRQDRGVKAVLQDCLDPQVARLVVMGQVLKAARVPAVALGR